MLCVLPAASSTVMLNHRLESIACFPTIHPQAAASLRWSPDADSNTCSMLKHSRSHPLTLLLSHL